MLQKNYKQRGCLPQMLLRIALITKTIKWNFVYSPPSVSVFTRISTDCIGWASYLKVRQA